MTPLLFICVMFFCQSISATDEAPKLLLAKTWDESIDPTGWWISEKYDGMRGFWDGKALWTRGGKPIHAPEYFLAELPKGIALDGELWLGRGNFEDTMSTVRRQTPDPRWRQIRFMVFDAPKAKGTVEKRMAFLKTQLPATAKHVRPVPQWRCKGKAHLISERDRIVKAGGKGKERF